MTETQAGFTPGPWTVEDGGEIVAGKVHVVCFGDYYDDHGSIGARWPVGSRGRPLRSAKAYREHVLEVQANARLIAQAPRLYELARAVVDHPSGANRDFDDLLRTLCETLDAVLDPGATPD